VRAARLRIGRRTILAKAASLDEEKREQENERQHYPRQHRRSVLRTWIQSFLLLGSLFQSIERGLGATTVLMGNIRTDV
jgi:hypothetical protein